MTVVSTLNSTPLNGYAANAAHASALAGVVGMGGLAGTQIHLAALDGCLALGGLAAGLLHTSALAGTLTLGGLQAAPPPPEANLLTFRRLSTPGQSEPLTFYPVNTANNPTAALAGVVNMGGLAGSQIRHAALDGRMALGGLAAGLMHSAALDGSLSLVGNLAASSLHASALDGWPGISGLRSGELHQSALSAWLSPGGLRARQADGYGALAGCARPWLEYSGTFDLNVPDGATANMQAAKPDSRVASGRASIDWRFPDKVRQANAITYAPGQAASARFAAGYATLPKAGAQGGCVLYPVASVTGRDGFPYQNRMGRAECHADLILYPVAPVSVKTALAFAHLPSAGNWRGFACPLAPASPSHSAALPIYLGGRLSVRVVFPLVRGLALRQGGRIVVITPPRPPRGTPNLLCFIPGSWPVNALVFNRSQPVRIIPYRRAYTVSNTFALYRLSDHTPLPAQSLAVDDGQGSWAWTLSAGLAELDAVERVAQTAEGPVIVRAEVNGYEWDFFIDDPEGSETPDGSSATIHGRSRTALFDDPFYPPLAFANSEDRLFSQLLGDLFIYNGTPLGVDVTTTVDDWLVPANQWSFLGTPVAALKKLAETPGAALASSMAGLGFTLAPHYPVLPWDWADATPYASIPRGYWASRGHRRETKPAFDCVVVSGDTANGILAQVQRDGTGGVWNADPVIDRLITHATPARQRGARILADTGRQAMETITLPIGTEFGLIPKGALLELQDTVTWRGLVRSVSISVALVGDGGMDIMQTLEVERHYG